MKKEKIEDSDADEKLFGEAFERDEKIRLKEERKLAKEENTHKGGFLRKFSTSFNKIMKKSLIYVYQGSEANKNKFLFMDQATLLDSYLSYSP